MNNEENRRARMNDLLMLQPASSVEPRLPDAEEPVISDSARKNDLMMLGQPDNFKASVSSQAVEPVRDKEEAWDKKLQDAVGSAVINWVPFGAAKSAMAKLKSARTGRPYEEELQRADEYIKDLRKDYYGSAGDKLFKVTDPIGRAVAEYYTLTKGLSLLGKVPGVKTVATKALEPVARVGSKIPAAAWVGRKVASTNPWESAAAISGIVGLGSTANELYHGAAPLQALEQGVASGANAGLLRVLGGYNAPRPVMYTALAPVEIAKSYARAKTNGDKKDVLDILGEAAGNTIVSTEYARGLAPNKTSNVKGSRNANRADLFKRHMNESTPAIKKQLEGVPDNTPLVEVNSPATKNLAAGVKSHNAKVASSISQRLEDKAAATLAPAQEKLAKIEKKITSGAHVIPRSKVDKFSPMPDDQTGLVGKGNYPAKISRRPIVDDAYKAAGGKPGDYYDTGTMYNAEKELTDKIYKNKQAGRYVKPELEARAQIRRIASPDAKTAKEWKLADTEFSNAKTKAGSLQEMADAWSTTKGATGVDARNLTGKALGAGVAKGRGGLYSLVSNTGGEVKDVLLNHYYKGLEDQLLKGYTVGQFKKALEAEAGNIFIDSTFAKQLGPAGVGLSLFNTAKESIRKLPKTKEKNK